MLKIRGFHIYQISEKKMKLRVLLLCFSIVGCIAIFSGFYLWKVLGPIELSTHGWFAIFAGVIGSFLLAGSLMALSFYSSRSGYDTKVAEYDPFQSLK